MHYFLVPMFNTSNGYSTWRFSMAFQQITGAEAGSDGPGQHGTAAKLETRRRGAQLGELLGKGWENDG